MPKPLVSIIIPVHNGELFLYETLCSALSQTYENTEIVLVDDGSTDSSREIALSFGDDVQIVGQEKSGSAIARNKGVEVARGDYIAFLDADDLWMRNKLAEQMNSLGSKCFSYTNAITFGDGVDREFVKSEVTKQYSGWIFEKLICGNFITTSSVLLERRLFLDLGGFDPMRKCLMDWPLWLRVARDFEVDWVSEPLVKYRVHQNSISRQVWRTLRAHEEVLSAIFAENRSDPTLVKLYHQAYENAYSAVAFNAEIGGNWSCLITASLKAIIHNPLNTRHWKQVAKGLLGLVYPFR
jgi:glycosyltransferase involved in cell wall biosynthesis